MIDWYFETLDVEIVNIFISHWGKIFILHIMLTSINLVCHFSYLISLVTSNFKFK